MGTCLLASATMAFSNHLLIKASIELIGSGTFLAISHLAHKYLDMIAPSKHKMTNHVFKEKTFGSSKLYYKNNVPILSINTDDPYTA